jgi:hypothetical protein
VVYFSLGVEITREPRLQTAAFGTSSGYLRWASRFARNAFPYIITSGTSSRWAAGYLSLVPDIAAIGSPGTVAMA